MRKITFIILAITLVLGILPFVNSATYIEDNNYYWTCLGKGEQLVSYVCKYTCCVTCQKNGYTAPQYKCVGSPCGCGGGGTPTDVEPPSMAVTSPNDGIMSDSRSIAFFVQMNENVDLYFKDSLDEARGFKKICSKCAKFDNKISFNDGAHVITLLASDSSGNRVEQIRSFFVDSKKPRIRAAFPKDKSYSNGTFIVQYDEANLQNVKLGYDQGQGYQWVTKTDCPNGNKKECTLLVPGLNQGPLRYYFVLEDTINAAQSKVLNTNIDTTTPSITITKPESITYNGSVLFDIDVSEDVTLEYMDYAQRSPRWNKLCSKCDNYYGKKSLSKGSHTMDIRVTDPAGNSAFGTASFFVK